MLGSHLWLDDEHLWVDPEELDNGEMLVGLAMSSAGVPEETVTVTDIVRDSSYLLWSTDIFEGLISELEGNGYSEGDNLFVLPYDWRLDIGVASELLNTKINQVKTLGIGKVDLVTHSMGGLVAKNYIDTYGKNSIDKLIMVAAPHLGSPKAAQVLTVGDSFGVPNLEPETLQTIGLNSPGAYELLPPEAYFDNVTGYIDDYPNNEVLLNYDDTQDFLLEKGLNPALLENAETFFDKHLEETDYSGIAAYNIGACNIATPAGYQFDFDGSIVNTVMWGTGDGTVPGRSVDYVDLASGRRLYSMDNGAEHSILPSYDVLKQTIREILVGGPYDSIFDLVTDTSSCDIEGDSLSWYSPVDIHVYDKLGRHVGPDKNGTIEREIPGVQYYVIGHRKFMFIPRVPGQKYEVKAVGTDTGTFDLRMSEYKKTKITKTTIYNKVSVDTSTTAELALTDHGFDGNLRLKRGNVPEEVKRPFSVINTGEETDFRSPTTSVMIAGEKTATGWYQSPTIVVLNVQEQGNSRLHATYYSIDGGEYVEYGKPIQLSEGVHYLRYYSVDNAGNDEAVQEVTVSVMNK